MIEIVNNNEFNNVLTENNAVLCYFSHKKCSVCNTLKPKLSTKISKAYPNIKMRYIDIKKFPEIAGQQRIFTVPVIVIFFEGKESYRYARNISVSELINTLKRPYQLLFE